MAIIAIFAINDITLEGANYGSLDNQKHRGTD